GPIAAHGIAIMSLRENLSFESQIVSDTAALNGLVETLLDVCPDIHVLRDPTRGGVTSTLSEIAEQARGGFHLRETAIPISEDVKGACEILGLDPLYDANEGKMIAIVAPEHSPAVLATMRSHPFGREAALIGEVVADHPGFVTMKTRIGGTRVV